MEIRENRKIKKSQEDVYKYFNDIPFRKANHMPIPLVHSKTRVLEIQIKTLFPSGVGLSLKLEFMDEN